MTEMLEQFTHQELHLVLDFNLFNFQENQKEKYQKTSHERTQELNDKRNK